MKKRVAGVVVVGAILLGMYLSNLWKGPGIGGEGDNVSVTSNSESVSVSVDPSEMSPTGMTPNETGGDGPEFLNVVVHGSYYRLPIGDDLDTGLDVPLGTVVARANDTTGTESGIRVRVLLEQSAQEGALADLYSALMDKGMTQGEIQEVSGFID